MDWYSQTEEQYESQTEAQWEGLNDGTPTSVTTTPYWLSLSVLNWGNLAENQWSVMQDAPHYDPPYRATIYVNGVCNHSIYVISN